MDRASAAASSFTAALLADMAERCALVIGNAGGGRAGFAWGWHGRGRLCGHGLAPSADSGLSGGRSDGAGARGAFRARAACRVRQGGDQCECAAAAIIGVDHVLVWRRA